MVDEVLSELRLVLDYQGASILILEDGKLTALSLVTHGNGGTNGGTGTSGPLKNVYECANVKTEEFDVFTNAGPSAAFRAPGHPQGSFALEATMDELAAKIRMAGSFELFLRASRSFQPIFSAPMRNSSRRTSEGSFFIRNSSGSIPIFAASSSIVASSANEP